MEAHELDYADTTVAGNDMVDIRAIDMLFLDELFQMGGGYVLKFSDRTFAQFFDEDLQINLEVSERSIGAPGRRHFEM
jgi:hypothetical protein